MSTGARLQRGFRRLGVGLAAPFLLGAAIFVGAYAISSPVELAKPNYFDKFDPKPKPGLFNDILSAPTDDWWKDAPLAPVAARSPEPLYWAASIGSIGLLLYVFCAGFGWVAAGFAKD